MYPALFGSFCLGTVMGWLVRFFLHRFSAFNVKVFGSVVSVLAGGVVIRAMGVIDPFYGITGYPVGLLVGVLAYPLISRFDAAMGLGDDDKDNKTSTPRRPRRPRK